MALTLEETRKYYAVYNTLEATHEYLEKEVALVESINANFEIALKSKAATDVFFSQMTAVIGNVRANVAKQQVQCDAKQLTVDTLDSKYQLVCFVETSNRATDAIICLAAWQATGVRGCDPRLSARMRKEREAPRTPQRVAVNATVFDFTTCKFFCDSDKQN